MLSSSTRSICVSRLPMITDDCIVKKNFPTIFVTFCSCTVYCFALITVKLRTVSGTISLGLFVMLSMPPSSKFNLFCSTIEISFSFWQHYLLAQFWGWHYITATFVDTASHTSVVCVFSSFCIVLLFDSPRPGLIFNSSLDLKFSLMYFRSSSNAEHFNKKKMMEKGGWKTSEQMQWRWGHRGFGSSHVSVDNMVSLLPQPTIKTSFILLIVAFIE